MSTLLLMASYALGALVVLDGARCPDDVWLATGRRKGTAIFWMVFLSLFGLGAAVAAWYGLFLLPRLSEAGTRAAGVLRRNAADRREAP